MRADTHLVVPQLLSLGRSLHRGGSLGCLEENWVSWNRHENLLNRGEEGNVLLGKMLAEIVLVCILFSRWQEAPRHISHWKGLRRISLGAHSRCWFVR